MANEEKIIVSLEDITSKDEYNRIVEQAREEAIESLNIYPDQIKHEDIDTDLTVTLIVSY